ncbi:hypothetical protein IG631_15087 [Alternaria alternata]|nr:hypothetical protein IG631_15087 [Alternaria alternata]
MAREGATLGLGLCSNIFADGLGENRPPGNAGTLDRTTWERGTPEMYNELTTNGSCYHTHEGV